MSIARQYGLLKPRVVRAKTIQKALDEAVVTGAPIVVVEPAKTTTATKPEKRRALSTVIVDRPKRKSAKAKRSRPKAKRKRATK